MLCLPPVPDLPVPICGQFDLQHAALILGRWREVRNHADPPAREGALARVSAQTGPPFGTHVRESTRAVFSGQVQ